MKLSEKMNGISTNINLLRFIAAILVIFSHSFYVSMSNDDPFFVFSSGQANLGGVAVAIFFFLSGFYVTKSLYKKNDVKQYLKNRCIRIFPQLWIVVLLSVVVLGPLLTTDGLKDYFGNGNTYLYLLNGIMLPIHNLPGVFEGNIYNATVNGPLWTLSIEFIAYCTLAIILIVSKYIFKNENTQKRLHILCICVLMLAFVGIDVFIDNDFLITVIRPVILFFVGVLYCDYAEKIKLNVPIAVIMIIITGIACKVGVLNYALIICLPYIIVTLTLGIRQIQINSKILVISYEMYLVGWPIQQIVTQCFGGEMSPYLNFIITLPIDLLVAYVLYIFMKSLEKKEE